MAITIAGLKPRREAAKKERDAFQPLMDEAYQYAIPSRKSTRNSGPGEKRVDQVFDSTAINSAMRFAGKYQQDLWPPEQRNFALEPGPLVRDPKQKERLAAYLEPISEILQAFFDNGDWDMAFHEMALELVGGTGAILCNPSDDLNSLWDPISVPIEELLLENGPNNKISGIFWDRKMSLRVAQETWPDGRFGEDLKKLKPEDVLEIHVDTVFDRVKGNPGAGRWRSVVWTGKQLDAPIHSSESRTCPWITPRYIRVPGETYGRGLAMLAMPEIKTLNTAKRLHLQAAAIAMLGIYTAVDDGVFNPDLSVLAPGAFWKVARNSGSLGRSVERFPDPRLDLSDLVIEGMQNNVREILMDNALPTDQAAVRSPTEILERVKRLATDQLGAFGRQIREVVVPAVQRAMEIAYDRGLIPEEIPLDQLLVQVRVKSPLALAREAARLQKIIQWLELVIAICTALGAPQGARRIAHVETLLLDAGTDMGVPERYKVTDGERKALDKAEQDQAIAMAAAQAAGGAVQGAAA